MLVQVRFIVLQNRQGKTRLAKYYIPLEESEKHKVEYEVHRLVVNKDPKFTNFVEGCMVNDYSVSLKLVTSSFYVDLAMRLQNVYRGYRTQSMLAASAVVVEYLG
ncbi:ap-2 complex subunit sigma [Phtheirospermum japonicum]|uniref:Ap-2 complex subunit sigma n=1 Tax=Phtheirospermum japonicum TaxID=374723 RepID=A0A830B991_9LAMI|nr:ap-2 complex subunit sigma [Phtheirospermum japonicum]